MPWVAALLAATLVAYTTYTFFPIPASYWTRRLESTFATLEDEDDMVPAWQVPFKVLAPGVERFAPAGRRRGLKNLLYWAHQMGTWRMWDEGSFMALMLVGGAAGFTLAIVQHAGPLILVVFIAIGALLPYTLMKGKAGEAQRTIRRQLPEVVQLIAMEAGSGSSMTEALERASQGRNLTSRWLRETLRSAHGRSLYSRDGHKGVLYERSAESGLPELVALALDIDFAHEQGYGARENLSRMALRTADEFLAEMHKKASELESRLVIPAVMFFFIPFLIAVLAPIAIPLVQSLQVR
jgi:Flp pilus assembly protein TadB